MILIPKDILNGFISEYKILGKTKKWNSIFLISLNPRACIMKVWKLWLCLRRFLIKIRKVGIVVVTTFHTFRITIVVSTWQTINDVTILSLSHINLSMITTQSTLLIHFLTLTVIWLMNWVKLRNLNLTMSREILYAEHLRGISVNIWLLQVDQSRSLMIKLRGRVRRRGLLLVQEYILENQIVVGWWKELLISWLVILLRLKF